MIWLIRNANSRPQEEQNFGSLTWAIFAGMRIHAVLSQKSRHQLGARRCLRATSNIWPCYWQWQWGTLGFRNVDTCPLQQVVTINPHFAESLENHQWNCLDSKASSIFHFMWKLAVMEEELLTVVWGKITLCHVLCWKWFPVYHMFSVGCYCLCCDRCFDS